MQAARWHADFLVTGNPTPLGPIVAIHQDSRCDPWGQIAQQAQKFIQRHMEGSTFSASCGAVPYPKARLRDSFYMFWGH